MTTLPEERGDQLYNLFYNVVSDHELAKRLTMISVENMQWAAFFKPDDVYLSKMKKHIYGKQS